MDPISISPIGRLRTPYHEKFGVPRQAGMAVAAQGRLVFEPEFRRREAVRGLVAFSHLWVVFLFDRVKENEVRLSVRPPRLGGNEKAGVFATRSPFRPNRIGLSVCKLEGIETEGREGPVLVLSGVDMVDGTPVLDVKPYLPYADRIEEATAGEAGALPHPLEVVVAEDVRERFDSLRPEVRDLIDETLRWDARPAYHEKERTYYLCVAGHEVAWKVGNGVCRVTGLSELEARTGERG